MGYSFSGVVDGLKEFYSSMRKLNIQIGTFEHTYNEIVSDVIFDTRNSELWNLIFEAIKHTDQTGEVPSSVEIFSGKEVEWDYRDFDLEHCNVFFKDYVLKTQYSYERCE